jgi:hypothetical protein
MPLSFPEDYERLGEHLAAIDPVLDKFADRTGFIVQRWSPGGLYPHRWLHLGERSDRQIQRSIQISMDTDERDERFDSFFPDIPYTVFAAAWLDDWTIRERFGGPRLMLSGIPFSRLVPELDRYLALFHQFVMTITPEFLLSCGSRSPVAGPSADS